MSLQDQVFRIGLKWFCFQPGGPPQATGFAEMDTGNFLLDQHQLEVPREFIASILPHPVAQPAERTARGQESLHFGQFHGSHADAKVKLASPDARADRKSTR